MPKFAANISLLFAELPYLERFAAAAAAGFDAVEILFPYELAAKETQRALLANGQQLLLINAPLPIIRVACPVMRRCQWARIGSSAISGACCAMQMCCGRG